MRRGRCSDAFLATLDEKQRPERRDVDLTDNDPDCLVEPPSGSKLQVGAMERNGASRLPTDAATGESSTRAARGHVEQGRVPEGDGDHRCRSGPRDTERGDSKARLRPSRFGRGEFYVAILGKPSTASKWMMQFGGHHLAINVTFAGPQNILAPTHTGTQPATYTLDGRTVRPLGDENDKAFALINALNADQQKQAILGVEVRNLVLGRASTARRSRQRAPASRRSTAAQRAMVVDLVREWG